MTRDNIVELLSGLYQKGFRAGVPSAGHDVDEGHAGLDLRNRRFDGRVVHKLVVDLGGSGCH